MSHANSLTKFNSNVMLCVYKSACNLHVLKAKKHLFYNNGNKLFYTRKQYIFGENLLSIHCLWRLIDLNR